jgi:HlyD family secretion protein
MQVIADVDEADIGQVENGQRVEFTVDAYPNDTFEGVVTQVRMGATGTSSSSSSASTSTSTVVTYEVVISADNPELKLKPRLTANVTIFTLEKENILTIPTKALKFVPNVEELNKLGYQVSDPNAKAENGQRLVWLVKGKTLEPKSVSVGETSGSHIEVLEGLSQGEEIAESLEISENAKTDEQTETSPFMPTPPGSKKK